MVRALTAPYGKRKYGRGFTPVTRWMEAAPVRISACTPAVVNWVKSLWF